MWGGNLNKLRRNINHIYMEVIAFVDTFNQVATSDDKAFTSLHPIYIVIIFELTEALMAIGMTKVTSNFTFADASQRVGQYDVSTFVHASKVLLFYDNIYQFVRKRVKILSSSQVPRYLSRCFRARV